MQSKDLCLVRINKSSLWVWMVKNLVSLNFNKFRNSKIKQIQKSTKFLISRQNNEPRKWSTEKKIDKTNQLYFVNDFQRKFSCFILYLLIILIYLNQSDLIIFNIFLNSRYWKCFRTSVIFISQMCSMGLSLDCNWTFLETKYCCQL